MPISIEIYKQGGKRNVGNYYCYFAGVVVAWGGNTNRWKSHLLAAGRSVGGFCYSFGQRQKSCVIDKIEQQQFLNDWNLFCQLSPRFRSYSERGFSACK